MNELMTQEQIDAAREEEEQYEALSGKHALKVFSDQLKDAGIDMPERDIFKYVKRKHVEASMHATFRLMGGVQGMTYWASQNPTEFYTAWMKTSNSESQMATGGITIQLPDYARSQLDNKSFDSQGFLINPVEEK